MDEIPKELEETPLRLEVVIDPEAKCMTMKMRIDDNFENIEVIPTEVISNDPLHHAEIEEINLSEMSELDRIIYLERQRILNLKLPRRSDNAKERRTEGGFEISETDPYYKLTNNEKSKLRMRKLRERESLEEHEFRKFRGRVHTVKVRLIQKLQSFEDESFIKELNKRAADKIKQKRLLQKAKETPAQGALRKKQVNLARRIRFLRNKAFETPEDLLREKEKRIRYLEKTMSRCTEEQRKAKRVYAAEKAKERRKQNKKEWKLIEMAIKGGTKEDV